jgi:replicative DNA helicase
MFLHREDRYKDQADKDNIVEVLIEKHRNGAIGKADLLFDAKTTTLLTIDKSHAPMAKAKSLDDF